MYPCLPSSNSNLYFSAKYQAQVFYLTLFTLWLNLHISAGQKYLSNKWLVYMSYGKFMIPSISYAYPKKPCP